MDVFEFTSYKEAVRWVLKDRKKRISPTYTLERLAKKCGIHKTYLSRVMNSDSHLSRDQMFLALDFLGVVESRRDYLMILHDFERTQLAGRKQELLEQISQIQSESLSAKNFVKAPEVSLSVERRMEYFLEPMARIVHMFLTIDDFAKNPRKIREKLNLSDNHLRRVLELLETLGVIRLDGHAYIVLIENMHLPKESSVFRANRIIQRQNILEQIGKIGNDDQLNFNVVFSANEKSLPALKKRFLTFVTDIESEVEKGEQEAVFQMVFDLVPWG